MRTVIVSAFLALAGACATQEPAGQAATGAGPCLDDPVYRQFDFWAGEWEVFTPDGQKAGENSITITQGGCMLFESWRPAGGGGGNGGVSVNFHDPLIGKWRQVWTSPSVLIDYVGGLDADGAMRLTGEIFYHGSGQRAAFTGVWTPMADGSVRQHFQQYDAGSESWTDWFIGVYRRKPGVPQP